MASHLNSVIIYFVRGDGSIKKPVLRKELKEACHRAIEVYGYGIIDSLNHVQVYAEVNSIPYDSVLVAEYISSILPEERIKRRTRK